ncbi:hypothetical protein ACI2KO_08695 [Pseudomonas piscis]|uniref:hypothetical protein n=1 Tax=Pseudomonas piscis TaxID=2614538 RepID=UPI00384D768A
MFDNYEFVSLRMTGRLIYFGKYARILMEGAKERQLNSGWDGILGNVYILNGNDWTPIGTISNPYLALVRSSEQFAEWKKQGLSDEKIRELSLKDGVISSVLAPVDVNGVTNLPNNGASKEELVRFAMIAAFGRAASGSSKLSKVTDGSSGSGGQATKGTQTVETALQVPGRVQSRVNLRNGSQAEGAGWNHLTNEHYSLTKNKSQFTVPQEELLQILQSKEVINTPITKILPSADGPRYVREVD